MPSLQVLFFSVFFQPTCFRKLRPFLMTQTDTSCKLCLCKLQNRQNADLTNGYFLFSAPPCSLFLSGISPAFSTITSPPLAFFFSFSFSLSLSLFCVPSLLCVRALSLFLSLRQMPLPSRNQLGLLVHGFQMFSRDELG